MSSIPPHSDEFSDSSESSNSSLELLVALTVVATSAIPPSAPASAASHRPPFVLHAADPIPINPFRTSLQELLLGAVSISLFDSVMINGREIIQQQHTQTLTNETQSASSPSSPNQSTVSVSVPVPLSVSPSPSIPLLGCASQSVEIGRLAQSKLIQFSTQPFYSASSHLSPTVAPSDSINSSPIHHIGGSSNSSLSSNSHVHSYPSNSVISLEYRVPDSVKPCTRLGCTNLFVDSKDNRSCDRCRRPGSPISVHQLCILPLHIGRFIGSFNSSTSHIEWKLFSSLLQNCWEFPDELNQRTYLLFSTDKSMSEFLHMAAKMKYSQFCIGLNQIPESANFDYSMVMRSRFWILKIQKRGTKEKPQLIKKAGKRARIQQNNNANQSQSQSQNQKDENSNRAEEGNGIEVGIGLEWQNLSNQNSNKINSIDSDSALMNNQIGNFPDYRDGGLMDDEQDSNEFQPDFAFEESQKSMNFMKSNEAEPDSFINSAPFVSPQQFPVSASMPAFLNSHMNSSDDNCNFLDSLAGSVEMAESSKKRKFHSNQLIAASAAAAAYSEIDENQFNNTSQMQFNPSTLPLSMPVSVPPQSHPHPHSLSNSLISNFVNLSSNQMLDRLNSSTPIEAELGIFRSQSNSIQHIEKVLLICRNHAEFSNQYQANPNANNGGNNNNNHDNHNGNNRNSGFRDFPDSNNFDGSNDGSKFPPSGIQPFSGGYEFNAADKQSYKPFFDSQQQSSQQQKNANRPPSESSPSASAVVHSHSHSASPLSLFASLSFSLQFVLCLLSILLFLIFLISPSLLLAVDLPGNFRSQIIAANAENFNAGVAAGSAACSCSSPEWLSGIPSNSINSSLQDMTANSLVFSLYMAAINQSDAAQWISAISTNKSSVAAAALNSSDWLVYNNSLTAIGSIQSACDESARLSRSLSDLILFSRGSLSLYRTVDFINLNDSCEVFTRSPVAITYFQDILCNSAINDTLWALFDNANFTVSVPRAICDYRPSFSQWNLFRPGGISIPGFSSFQCVDLLAQLKKFSLLSAILSRLANIVALALLIPPMKLSPAFQNYSYSPLEAVFDNDGTNSNYQPDNSLTQATQTNKFLDSATFLGSSRYRNLNRIVEGAYFLSNRSLLDSFQPGAPLPPFPLAEFAGNITQLYSTRFFNPYSLGLHSQSRRQFLSIQLSPADGQSFLVRRAIYLSQRVNSVSLMELFASRLYSDSQQLSRVCSRFQWAYRNFTGSVVDQPIQYPGLELAGQGSTGPRNWFAARSAAAAADSPSSANSISSPQISIQNPILWVLIYSGLAVFPNVFEAIRRWKKSKKITNFNTRQD